MATQMLNKLTFLAMIIISMVLGLIPLAYGAIPCGQIQLKITPCLGYVRGPGGPAPGQCCNGLRAINNEARTTPDRQDACKCIKNTVLSIPGINLATVAATPAKCGINLPYEINPNINCNTVRRMHEDLRM
ncbi:hypothetical protein TanjilG_12129 [Lupinus angustifolius]|uniref:Non-specific lipid-transfer protein n=1 Tax=Lupinus angustifolius TaxID=3871 RepID=A0A1J7GDR1_LUPAN|nr:PREDICTED: non-specific lipid-transfer protein 1-like [Lupinus angustifolius]OIV98543.1 hypothetical protein TanjilG_12129 [Lupinus angustifolius]